MFTLSLLSPLFGVRLNQFIKILNHLDPHSSQSLTKTYKELTAFAAEYGAYQPKEWLDNVRYVPTLPDYTREQAFELIGKYTSSPNDIKYHGLCIAIWATKNAHNDILHLVLDDPDLQESQLTSIFCLACDYDNKPAMGLTLKALSDRFGLNLNTDLVKQITATSDGFFDKVFIDLFTQGLLSPDGIINGLQSAVDAKNVDLLRQLFNPTSPALNNDQMTFLLQAVPPKLAQQIMPLLSSTALQPFQIAYTLARGPVVKFMMFTKRKLISDQYDAQSEEEPKPRDGPGSSKPS